jgi:signal transduction protein with GAF and PtsI domain
MNTHNISRIKYVLRQSDLGELKALMADGLKHDNPHVLRACLPDIWKNTVWADCCGWAQVRLPD